jgi:hypothetical protein
MMAIRMIAILVMMSAIITYDGYQGFLAKLLAMMWITMIN